MSIVKYTFNSKIITYNIRNCNIRNCKRKSYVKTFYQSKQRKNVKTVQLKYLIEIVHVYKK